MPVWEHVSRRPMERTPLVVEEYCSSRWTTCPVEERVDREARAAASATRLGSRSRTPKSARRRLPVRPGHGAHYCRVANRVEVYSVEGKEMKQIATHRAALRRGESASFDLPASSPRRSWVVAFAILSRSTASRAVAARHETRARRWRRHETTSPRARRHDQASAGTTS